MFRKHVLPWLIIFNEGEGGASEGTGSDPTPTQGEPSGESTSQNEGGAEQSSGHNPNWDGLLNELPDEYLRGKARPFLEEYDRNNNKRFEKVQQQFSQYQPLVDNEIPFDEIQLAFRLQNEIQQNPQDTFMRLAQHLGTLGIDVVQLLQPNQQQNQRQPDNKQNQGQGQTSNGMPEGVDLDDLDPRLRQILELQAQQNQRIQQTNDAILQSLMMDKQREAQIQQSRQEETWYNDTVKTLDRLEVPKTQRNFFVQFAVADAQMNRGVVDLDRSWKSYQQQMGQAVQSRANSSAPDVSAGVGNLSRDSIDFKKMSKDDVNDLAISMLKQRNGGK